MGVKLRQLDTAEAEIKVLLGVSPGRSKFTSFSKPGVGQNIALHAASADNIMPTFAVCV